MFLRWLRLACWLHAAPKLLGTLLALSKLAILLQLPERVSVHCAVCVQLEWWLTNVCGHEQNHLMEMEARRAAAPTWDTVRYMIAQIQYGGRITDDFDALLMRTYAARFFHQVRHCMGATITVTQLMSLNQMFARAAMGLPLYLQSIVAAVAWGRNTK